MTAVGSPTEALLYTDGGAAAAPAVTTPSGEQDAQRKQLLAALTRDLEIPESAFSWKKKAAGAPPTPKGIGVSAAPSPTSTSNALEELKRRMAERCGPAVALDTGAQAAPATPRAPSAPAAPAAPATPRGRAATAAPLPPDTPRGAPAPETPRMTTAGPAPATPFVADVSASPGSGGIRSESPAAPVPPTCWAAPRQSPRQTDDEAGAATGITVGGSTACGSEATMGTPRHADEKRQQFLNLLARGLQEGPPPTASGRRTPDPGCAAGAPLISPTASSARASPIPGGDVEGGDAGESATQDGPDFFAGVQALQEKLAQRRQLGSKLRASSANAAPSTPAFMSEPRAQGWGTSSGSGAAPMPPPLPTGPRPPHGGGPGTPRSRPVIRSERRRPKPPVPAAESFSQAAGSSTPAAEEDDALFGDSGADELLKWANEVLRKAAEDAQKAERGEPSTPPSRPRSARASPPASGGGGSGDPFAAAAGSPGGGVPRPPPSPRAALRRRRAEELADEMRRMNEEAEETCQRLASEEKARRRQMEAEENEWRGRISGAAEELRNNLFNSNLFGASAAGPGGGPGGPRSARGGSAPPPAPPPRMPGEKPPFSGRRASNKSPGHTAPANALPLAAMAAAFQKHEEAWSKLEAILDTRSDTIRLADIPWPPEGCSITGVLQGDPASLAKRRLASALRRWHPDKWRRILDRVPEEEHEKVTERVKNIAQRLLEEKKKLTEPGGALFKV